MSNNETSITNNGNFMQRRLHRSSSQRWLGGVCGGFAETYGWNVALVRLLAFVLVVLPAPMFLIYIAAWIIMPLY